MKDIKRLVNQFRDAIDIDGSVAKSETQKTLSLTNRQSKQVFPLIF